jgi:hypothetical protein
MKQNREDRKINFNYFPLFSVREKENLFLNIKKNLFIDFFRRYMVRKKN